MSEHVVLKNVKKDLKLALNAPVQAGMQRVTVDANNLSWLVQQAEKAKEYEEWLEKIAAMKPEEHTLIDATYWSLFALGKV